MRDDFDSEFGTPVWTPAQSILDQQNLDHDALFMPDGKIPRPAVVPKAARTAGNLFNVRSLKLGRDDIFLASELEWVNNKRVEADPDVVWYCEHYPKVAVRFKEKVVVTVFDNTIRYKSGRYLLQEVKYLADSKPKEGTRTYWQLKAQRALCDLWRVDYEIADEIKIRTNQLELENLKQIQGWLLEVPKSSLQDQIMGLVDYKGTCTIGTLVTEISRVCESSVIMTICFLLHHGDLEAPLAKQAFDKNLPLWKKKHESL